MNTTPQVGVPTDIREITEQSIDHVRNGINGYLEFFQRGIPSNVMERRKRARKSSVMPSA